MISDSVRSTLAAYVRSLLSPPADLAVGLVAVSVTAAAALLLEGPLGTAAGLPLLLFIPGYAVVSALFPRSADATSRVAPVTLVQRAGLSFGLSVALLPLLGLSLFLLGLSVDALSVVVLLAGVSVVGLVMAAYRRWQLPADQRFVVPYDRWWRTARESTFGSDSHADTALNLGLGLAVVVTLSLLTYGVVASGAGPAYTESSIVVENESGALVASGYPDELNPDESEPFVLELTNHEGVSVQYTYVVELQRVDQSGTIVERAPFDRGSALVADGETWRGAIRGSPGLTGEDLRLTVYLYEGSVPATPRAASATNHLFIWVDVPVSQ
ncbi:DUF1616 domain-containing protein [Salinirubellus salinus]|uniref:DUF1616 domain-containing protein n=1 Tax=Salinirubellus salinus TaxID=1364945 RepID=A0A9E7UB03_9EURY|nr:DUF1616 domain-containing protein [Salinirubellus salinus]UWM54334.1 DUF1616 domain-containing protein [Salinirubellus salinus]